MLTVRRPASLVQILYLNIYCNCEQLYGSTEVRVISFVVTATYVDFSYIVMTGRDYHTSAHPHQINPPPYHHKPSDAIPVYHAVAVLFSGSARHACAVRRGSTSGSGGATMAARGRYIIRNCWHGTFVRALQQWMTTETTGSTDCPPLAL